MNKVTFDVFSNMLSMAVELMTDDERNDFYIDLLESGSSCYSPSEGNELCFSIANGLLEFEARGYKHLEPGFDDDAKLSNEDIKEMDDIVNSDVDDDPIDFSVLKKEADELEEDYTELTDEELIEIGIDPNTKKPIEMEFVINQLESLELNSTEMITEDGDCQIWKDDVIALKYALVIIKTLKQLRYK